MIRNSLNKYKEPYQVHIVGKLYLVTGRRLDYTLITNLMH